MTDRLFDLRPLAAALALATALGAAALPERAAAQGAPATSRAPRVADYIAAVVNQELITNGEIEQRIAQVKQNAKRANATLPPDDQLRKDVIESLIEERVLLTFARESGTRVEDADIDRAMATIAAQNQVTLPQLRERLRAEGLDYARFRDNVRDQILVERVREREVQQRIKISESEIDALLTKERAKAGTAAEYNIAQILVTVPDSANEAQVAERRARAEAALARVRGGEAFEAVAREVSEDGNKARGGEIGMKPAARLPDLFVESVRSLQPGQVAPTLVRSGAGFHVLKLLDKREAAAFTVTQTRARHILLRPSPQLRPEVAARRLAEYKRLVVSGQRSFEQLAREFSEDGSAPQGGDLGWTNPGTFVPEFEEAMNALPLGGISDPVTSRFGLHLIQVVDRRQVTLDAKQQREQARNVLREQKFDEAYTEWLREMRSRAYVEMREPPA